MYTTLLGRKNDPGMGSPLDQYQYQLSRSGSEPLQNPSTSWIALMSWCARMESSRESPRSHLNFSSKFLWARGGPSQKSCTLVTPSFPIVAYRVMVVVLSSWEKGCKDRMIFVTLQWEGRRAPAGSKSRWQQSEIHAFHRPNKNFMWPHEVMLPKRSWSMAKYLALLRAHFWSHVIDAERVRNREDHYVSGLSSAFAIHLLRSAWAWVKQSLSPRLHLSLGYVSLCRAMSGTFQAIASLENPQRKSLKSLLIYLVVPIVVSTYIMW